MAKLNKQTNQKDFPEFCQRFWGELEREISGERIKAEITELFQLAKWFSADKLRELHKKLAKSMEQAGMKDVEILHLPADGKTTGGGWAAPYVWEIKEATLDIVSPSVAESRLACYSEAPTCLMAWSGSTPKGGVTAEVVPVGKNPLAFRGTVKGKMVLVDKMPYLAPHIGTWALHHGVVGILSDHVALMGLRTSKEVQDDSMWYNRAMPFWGGKHHLFGIAMAPRQGKKLRALLRHNQKVILHAMVDTKMYEGTSPLVTGILPGRTKQEVLITAHSDEPGANDNLSGCLAAVEIVRALNRLVKKGRLEPLRRTIRLVFTNEVRGMQVLVNQKQGWPWRNPKAGINLDMVGGDHVANRTAMHYGPVTPVTASYAEVLLGKIMEKGEEYAPQHGCRGWNYKVAFGFENDNILADYKYGTPFTYMGQPGDRYYNLETDNPDHVSSATLKLNSLIAGTWAGVMANAGAEEMTWLADQILFGKIREMWDDRKPTAFIKKRNQWVRSLRWESLSHFLWSIDWTKEKGQEGKDGLLLPAKLEMELLKRKPKLPQRTKDIQIKLTPSKAKYSHKLDQMVPEKLFHG